MNLKSILAFFLLTSSVFSLQANSPKFTKKYFSTYQSWQKRIIQSISAAKNEIKITTKRFNDEKIYQALAAKAKQGISVFVLTPKMSSYQKRFAQLGIQTGTIPSHKIFNASSTLLIDNEIRFLANTLSPPIVAQMIQSISAPKKYLPFYRKVFTKHQKFTNASVARNTKKRVYSNASGYKSPPRLNTHSQSNPHGYDYDNRSKLPRLAPEGIAGKLPKTPKYLQRKSH